MQRHAVFYPYLSIALDDDQGQEATVLLGGWKEERSEGCFQRPPSIHSVTASIEHAPLSTPSCI